MAGLGAAVAVPPVLTDAAEHRSMRVVGILNSNPMVLPDNPYLRAFREGRAQAGYVEGQKPTVFEFSEFVRDGGLISYGASLSGTWRRGAYYVERILKGGSAGNLPVEQPTILDLAVNRKTAQQLGLT